MKITSVACGVLVTAMVAGWCWAADKNQTKPTKAPAADAVPRKQAVNRADDEKALRKSAADFAAAFNARDARAIAAQFAPHAELVDLDGNVVQGREVIEKNFPALFESVPLTVAVEIESLRFIGDNIAIEDGHLLYTSDDDTKFRTRYTAVHVRDGGRWLVASSRDVASPDEQVSPHQRLEPLAWMVGDWVEERGDSIVVISCRWDDNKNFLLSDYTVKVAGQATMSGSQRIGWDPLTRQIKTWTFDSDGGYGEGYWHLVGDAWLLKITGVSADGRAGSATQIHTRVNDHTRTWRAVDRIHGGEPLPEIDEITVVRAAPKPNAAGRASRKNVQEIKHE